MEERQKVAKAYLERGFESQMSGDLKEAIRLYRLSIETEPTAEAYTCLGWTFSFLGELSQAIEYCERAILIDPEFGNPYNDIGTYLIEQGKFDEAIPYLEKATQASRYDSYCYPHFNLGRAYELKGMLFKAREEYEKALSQNPNYPLAKEALSKLQATLQ